MKTLTDTPETSWDYQQGLLDLIESGCSFSQIEQKLHEGDLALPQQTRAGLNTSKLESLIKWLQGFRMDAIIYEDEKFYLPFIELWAPPGGKAQFSYELTNEKSKVAEICLFGYTGFGGGSRRKISESIKMSTEKIGRSFSIGILLTVTRYQHKTDKTRSFDKIDIKGIQDGFDYNLQDVPLENFILENQDIPESSFLPEEYSNIRYFRLSDSKQKTIDTYAPSIEISTDWSFQLSLPLLIEKIKIGISTKNSNALKASFECPTGYDYVFFSRFGENPAVPYCARLLK
jgi:hypothetical protein